MKDHRAPNGAAPRALSVSGPTPSPSANILCRCLLVDGLALLVMALLAGIFSDLHGVLSVVLGTVLVMVFFGLSLLAAHLFGRRRPQALISIFFMSYFVKVLGFAAVLFAVGTPDWLDKPWFLGAAVAAVLLWQGVEVWTFSQQRFLRFDEPATAQRPRPGAGTGEPGVNDDARSA